MLSILLIAVSNIFFGFVIGYATKQYHLRTDIRQAEKQIYCHGYEDGFYLGIGEYEPELFRIEIAEKAYVEYKALRHGPTKH